MGWEAHLDPFDNCSSLVLRQFENRAKVRLEVATRVHPGDIVEDGRHERMADRTAERVCDCDERDDGGYVFGKHPDAVEGHWKGAELGDEKPSESRAGMLRTTNKAQA